MITPQTLKGFRDFLPKQAKKRQYVIDILRKTFESFGFDPLETPALEYEEVLLGKYGDEGDKLMYRFEDNGKRKVALRYDQTVPLARVVAQYQNELPFPFKRYQIQPVWRAENTQKGRFREFMQCDIDIIGSKNLLTDGEIISCALSVIKKLGFKKYKMMINEKTTIDERFKMQNIPEGQTKFIATEMDKKDKKPEEEIFKSIYSISGSITMSSTASGTITSINDLNNPENKRKIQNWLNNYQPDSYQLNNFIPKPKPSINEINEEFEKAKTDDNIIKYFELMENPPSYQKIQNILQKLDVGEDEISYNPNLVRGLSYYTGYIFELQLTDYQGGSVGGGGRYDNLVGQFTGQKIPAVGFAFGFDRLIEAMEELNLFPQNLNYSSARILVSIFNTELFYKSIELLNQLRNNNINAEIYDDPDQKLDKQLKYADKKGIPFVAIIGPDEVKNNMVTLKNLKEKKQETVPLDELVKLLRLALSGVEG